MQDTNPTAAPRRVLGLGAALRPVLAKGCAGLILGAGLSLAAVALSNGALGLLSLLTVFGTLTWMSLGLIRNVRARFQPPGRAERP